MTDPQTASALKHCMALRDRSRQKKPKRLLDSAPEDAEIPKSPSSKPALCPQPLISSPICP